jgi:signal transduction histidine kinase
LTSIKLLIQITGQRPDRALSEKQFGVVLEEISRMEATIEQLLDFSRPSRANRAWCDIREVVGRAMSLVEGRAQHGRVVMTSEMPENPVGVDGDAQQLQQVFNNLLQNGIEAMGAGGTLHIKVEPAGDLADRARVRISDSGPGIPAPLMDRLFDPFVTDKTRGTGLGLAISRRIVEDHGGRLEAANQPDGGAMFTVELPHAASEVDSEVAVSNDLNMASSEFSKMLPEQLHAQVAGH